jgi:phosphatidylglycerophosphate synthase
MKMSHAPQSVPATHPSGLRPIAKHVLLSAALTVVVLTVSWVLAGRIFWLPVLGFVLGSGAVAVLLWRHWSGSRLGAANALTLMRLALAALMLLPIARPDMTQGATGWAIFALALMTLALDGLDGPLARRSGLAGPWGARFDMEVDAVFGLLLALVVWRSGAAGVWVLLLGGMRYLFVLASFALPWLAQPLPQRFRRKLVCVLQIGALVVMLAPLFTPPLSQWIALVALGLLTWSFALDVIWLARRK